MYQSFCSTDINPQGRSTTAMVVLVLFLRCHCGKIIWFGGFHFVIGVLPVLIHSWLGFSIKSTIQLCGSHISGHLHLSWAVEDSRQAVAAGDQGRCRNIMTRPAKHDQLLQNTWQLEELSQAFSLTGSRVIFFSAWYTAPRLASVSGENKGEATDLGVPLTTHQAQWGYIYIYL